MSSVVPSDIAYRVLRLEQQLDAYQRLHMEELEQFRQTLNSLKDQVLALIAQQEKPNEAGACRS